MQDDWPSVSTNHCFPPFIPFIMNPIANVADIDRHSNLRFTVRLFPSLEVPRSCKYQTKISNM